MATTNESKDKDDNLMAALAHAGIIFCGILLPLIIWLIQKDKSKYVSFQAKQALVYQVIVICLLGVSWIMAFVLMFVLIGFLMIPLVVLFGIITVAYGLYGAYKTYKGEDFKYALIGNMISK